MSKLDLQIKKLGSPIEQELPRLAEQSERIDRERFTGATALGASSAGKLRLLSLRPVTNKRGTGGEEQGLVAEYYDAERNQCIVIQSGASNEEPTVKTTARQPLPDFAEFAEACRVLEKHEVFGPAVRAGHARLYRPMPPMKLSGAGIAPTRRAINVGILPDASTSLRHEIVAVGSADGAVERFSNGAPPNAEAGPTACGPQNTVQQTASRGTAGRVELTVTDGDTELWRLTAVRPAESSGTNGSGIELLDVRYRGRMVLKRAHLPILNVLYPPGDHGCGPSYRDWQWEEGQIRAEGSDVAPGFRDCTRPPETIFESGSDEGNFLGVGIYRTDDEITLVSEMEAGWYRYVSRWTLKRDGTIQPRFGFAGVNNSCICNVHIHHAYWRFEFDIDGTGRNSIEEFNEPAQAGGEPWARLRYETRREKNSATGRHWRISDAESGRGYLLVPGSHDGTADADFGVGDLWALKNRFPAEIDDGQGFTTEPAEAKVGINRFVNQELIENTNLVLWYAGHFAHDVNDHDDTPHIVGPDLKPVGF